MSDSFQFKVVVAGPFAAGKTTFIQSISQTAVIGTEAPTSGSEASVKATTTVGMEYGSFTVLDDDYQIDLLLYGVPGQDRFRFMWDIVAEGMDVLLLLVDATKPETWSEALAVGDYLVERHAPPVLVAVNRAHDEPDAVEAIREQVAIAGARYSTCDVTDPTSARETLIELLAMLLDELAVAEPAGS